VILPDERRIVSGRTFSTPYSPARYAAAVECVRQSLPQLLLRKARGVWSWLTTRP
jgi:hypothetical protein